MWHWYRNVTLDWNGLMGLRRVKKFCRAFGGVHKINILSKDIPQVTQNSHIKYNKWKAWEEKFEWKKRKKNGKLERKKNRLRKIIGAEQKEDWLWTGSRTRNVRRCNKKILKLFSLRSNHFGANVYPLFGLCYY